MVIVSPLTSKSLNLLKALNSACNQSGMDKRPGVIVQNEEYQTKKDHIICVFGKSELITKRNYGECVERSTESSSSVNKIVVYPSGKKECHRLYTSLAIQFKNLRENAFIEGDVYILGKKGRVLLSEKFSGYASNLKEINFDTFLFKHELNIYLVNNALNIHVRVISVSQTYKCASDKCNYQVHNLPKIYYNFQRLMCYIEEYSDVILQMDSNMINCHKYILALESQALLILFRSCERNILEMHNKSYAIIKDLVQFIYCGNIQLLNFNHICQLYVAADEFGILYLKDICSLILNSSLSELNVPYIFELSMTYKDQYLREMCINFVKKHDIKSLKETFVKRSWKIKN